VATIGSDENIFTANTVLIFGREDCKPFVSEGYCSTTSTIINSIIHVIVTSRETATKTSPSTLFYLILFYFILFYFILYFILISFLYDDFRIIHYLASLFTW
jgi:hypothetical protein